MRFAQIDNFEVVNGQHIGMSLYVQGCHFHCKNCFNDSTWDFNGGTEWTSEIETEFLQSLSRDFIKRITILGGEPLAQENVKTVKHIIQRIRDEYPDKVIWLYSGYTLEECFTNKEPFNYIQRSIISKVDVFVDGRFIEELKDFTLPFRGSTNQRLIDIPASFKSNSIILKTI